MSYKQTLNLIVIMIVVSTFSVGCATRSAKMLGRDGDLLDQAINTSKSTEDTGISIQVKGWGQLEPLSSELEKRGYKINMNNPVYKVEGDSKFSLGPHIGSAIAWDVLMAVPSVFLPVPLFGSYAWKLDVTISDRSTGNVLGQVEKTVDYWITGYSLWGLAFGVPGHVQSDLVAITGLLTDEELKKLIEK